MTDKANSQADEYREMLRKRIDMLSDTYVIRLMVYLDGIHAGKEIIKEESKKEA